MGAVNVMSEHCYYRIPTRKRNDSNGNLQRLLARHPESIEFPFVLLKHQLSIYVAGSIRGLIEGLFDTRIGRSNGNSNDANRVTRLEPSAPLKATKKLSHSSQLESNY